MTRRRGRQTADPRLDGRDEWLITGPNGQTRIAKYAYAPLALGEAQDIAAAGNDPLTLRVLRRALVGSGPPVPIYRVDRDEQGTVHTTILSRED